MKVFYDCQIYNSQRWGGISRYFVELIRRMPSDIDCSVGVRFTHNVHLPQIMAIGSLPLLPFKKDISRRFNYSRSRAILRKGAFDVFHPTYYNPYFLEFTDKPFVLTVHDMIHERFPDAFSPSDTTSQSKRLLVEKATAVIAISESTKRDLIELYGIDERKIRVIYHGRGVTSGREEPVEGLPDDYILYVGGRMLYKNFGLFAEAFAAIATRYPGLQFVCSGKPFNKNEVALLTRLGILDRVKNFFVRDSQMKSLYAGARCFVFPSLYEGFGFPALESFAAGCPTLLSNTSSLPEVGGNGALYFDPYKVDDIAHAICTALDDNRLCEDLRAKGYAQLERFSWEKCASATAELYRSLC